MALNREKLEAREMEAAARKISRYCNKRGCIHCRLYIGNRDCLIMSNAPADWESVLDDVSEWEAAGNEGKTWQEIQQEKNGRKDNY